LLITNNWRTAIHTAVTHSVIQSSVMPLTSSLMQNFVGFVRRAPDSQCDHYSEF
jgi:hypothetical protein